MNERKNQNFSYDTIMTFKKYESFRIIDDLDKKKLSARYKI